MSERAEPLTVDDRQPESGVGRRVALAAVPVAAVLLVLLAAVWRPAEVAVPAGGASDQAVLPSQGENVVAVAVDFGGAAGDGLDAANLAVLAEVDAFFRATEGLRGYSSPLRATVVRATEFDIVVRPFVPAALRENYDERVAAELRAAYERFPEIHPYWSADFGTAAFYLELGSRLARSPAALVEGLDGLQRRLAEQHGAVLHYTGVRPVAELTGRLMVRDLRALLPLVGAATVLILLLTFGGARGVLVALAATASAATAGGALFVLLAGAGTPLLILAPVFAGGLFTDYAIHMGYHAGWRGDGSARAARGYLRLPQALTAATTVIGFLALGGLGSTVHRFVAVTVSAGALAALALALWWMPAAGRLRVSRRRNAAGLLGRRIHRLLVGALLALSRHRVPATLLLALPVVVAAPQVGRLAPEPYPLHQLPAASTIVQAESIFNREFAGTVPFAVAIDAGTPDAFLRPEAMQHLRAAHRILGELPAVGHRHSLLTVVERIHRYFAAGEADARELPASDDPERFARIVSQYLLFYSASATPADYAALADGSLSAVQVHGILRYRDYATLGELQRAVAAIREELPREWRIAVAGPARELIAHGERLRRNWLSSLAASAVLIFVTVLAVFRNLREALLSLVPAATVLIAVTGLAPGFGVRIDDYTVIALAITMGLTVDYTIHVLNALHHTIPAGRQRRAAGAGATGAPAQAAAKIATARQPVARQPAAGQPATGQPAAGQPATGQPATGQPATGQPATGQPAAGQPAAGQPATGQPATGQPAAGQPATGQPATGQPATGQPATGQPATGQPATGQPATG
ncbi:MAG: hypothetical protein OXH96_04920, partial [Spirochaetaceae bacterium]|nr:hypothetical protein [Spirochaetaceae bacterium]